MFWVQCPSCGENACRADQPCCAQCSIRIANAMNRERARWDAYAALGILDLELFLERHAAFDEWLAAAGRT